MTILIFAISGALMAGAAGTAQEIKKRREAEKAYKAKCAKYRRATAYWT